MTTLLQINTSVFGEDGQSSQLARHFVARWRASHPDAQVVVRDLANAPIPHLDGARAAALFAKPDARSAEQQAIADEADALLEELRAADVVVLGLPLYNFGIPSTLKAYFDHLARAGLTFRYTADGSEGLLADRKVYVLAARGGYYEGTPADTQTPYVRSFLALIGIRDVEFVYAEGLNVSTEAKQRALDAARGRIERLAA